MKPLIQRLPVSVSYREDILLYGQDNLYPQRIEAVIDRSPITKSALQVTADFLNGMGFEQNGDQFMGKYTADELLVRTSPDFATYGSCAFILDMNMAGSIAEVTPIEFKYVRLGVPMKGTIEIKYVKVSPDWEGAYPSSMKAKPIIYALWPGTMEEAREMMFEWNADLYGPFNGFLYYFTPKGHYYPLSTVDSVIDSSQTNAEIQLFELSGVQNGFLGATLLKHPGTMNPEERRRVNEQVATMKGAENANSVIVWEVPDGYDNDVLEQFPANNQDKLFENTNKTTVNRIIQTLAIPPSLLGIMPENSFFSMSEIEDSYKYFNVRTNNRRAMLARVFEDLGQNFVTPLDFGMIKPQEFTFLGEVKKAEPVAPPAGEEEETTVPEEDGTADN